MSNPFDDETGAFLVLANHEGQHCLWPAFAEVPAGWSIVKQECARQDALDFIEHTWTDLRPRSLAAAAAANGN